MSTRISKIEKDNVTLVTTRFAGPSNEGRDRIRMQILLYDSADSSGAYIDLNRQEWNTLQYQVNKAFKEFPEPTQTG